jgi:hypothetical protein
VGGGADLSAELRNGALTPAGELANSDDGDQSPAAPLVEELTVDPSDTPVGRLLRQRRWLVAAVVAASAVAATLGVWRVVEPPAMHPSLPPVVDRATEIVNRVAVTGNPADAQALESVYRPDAALHEGDQASTGIDAIKGAALANAGWGWSIERTGAGSVNGTYVVVPMTWTCQWCSVHGQSGFMVFEIIQGKIGNQWWFGQ